MTDDTLRDALADPRGPTMTPLTLCPTCGYAMDDATGLTGARQPKEGDVGICLSCGAMLIYDADGQPSREAGHIERKAYSTPLVEAAIESIRQRGPLPGRGDVA